MLSKRRAKLFLHFLHPRLWSCYPLAASAEITDTAGQAPYFCRHFNTGNHLLKAPCNNGGHGPLCTTEGHPLAHHTLCRDAPLQAFPVKKEGYDEAQPNVCIQSFVKLSAYTKRRKKGHLNHGDVVFSGFVDANGHPSDGEVKIAEGNAKLLKASRKKGHARSREVKAKASREISFLSYGDAKVSESEACNHDVAGLCREGNGMISTCESCSREDGDSGATACRKCGRSTEIHSPSSNGFVTLPVTQGHGGFSSSVSCVRARYDSEVGHAVQHHCSTDGATAAGAFTSKTKNNCLPSHVSDVLSGTLDPSLHLLQASFIGTSKGKELSQIDIAELQRKVELLEAEKMSVDDAARLFKKRAFGSASFEHLSAVLQVLKEFFGTGEGPCQALARSSLFLLHPVELLHQTLQVLTNFHINKETARRLFTCRQPPLYVKVELLQRRLLFLKEFGFTAQAINTMCCRHPMILRSSVESMLRNVEFLERAGITKERLLNVLQKRSRVLDCSVDDNLILKFECLQQLGFSGEKLLAAILVLFAPSLKKLQANAQAIRDLGFSDEDVQRMITQQPTLLGLTTHNLKAKFDFLVHEQNRDMAEIVKCPVCLLYSLHGRIIPRLKRLENLGLSKVYALSTILICSDVRFRNMSRVVV